MNNILDGLPYPIFLSKNMYLGVDLYVSQTKLALNLSQVTLINRYASSEASTPW